MQTIQNNFGEIHGDSDMRDLARVTPEELAEENEMENKAPRDNCAMWRAWGEKMQFLRSILAEVEGKTPNSCLVPRLMFVEENC